MRLLSKIKALKKYSVLGLFSLVLNFVYTKFVLRGAFLVRRPAHIRVMGEVVLGSGFMASPGLIMDVLAKDAVLRIGKNVKLNQRVHLAVMEKVEIGDDCLLGSNILITDHSHGHYSGEGQSSPFTPPNERPLDISPVVIGDRVWIGDNVVVLHGSSVGSGTIVGANSIVKGALPDNVIAAGAPARPIKQWDSRLNQWIRV